MRITASHNYHPNNIFYNKDNKIIIILVLGEDSNKKHYVQLMPGGIGPVESMNKELFTEHYLPFSGTITLEV